MPRVLPAAADAPDVEAADRRHVADKPSVRAGRALRVLFLLMTVVYSTYIQTQAALTRSWQPSWIVGYAPSNTNLDGKMFIVRLLDIGNASASVTQPVLMTMGGGTTLTGAFFNQCQSVLMNLPSESSVWSLTEKFSHRVHSFFPFLPFVEVLCMVSLALTYTHESKLPCSIEAEDGIAASTVDKAFVVRVTKLVALAVAMMLVMMASTHTFARIESCRDTYKDDARSTLCAQISSCGLGIGSVVAPNDLLAANYPLSLFFLAAGLVASGLLDCSALHCGDNGPLAEPVVLPNDRRPRDLVAAYVARLWKDGMPTYREVRLPWSVLQGERLAIVAHEQCPVCLSAFHPSLHRHVADAGDSECGAVARLRTSASPRVVRVTCAHVFHERCIDQWLRTQSSCPVCRGDLVGLPEQSMAPRPTATATLEDEM